MRLVKLTSLCYPFSQILLKGSYWPMSRKHPECPLYNPLNCKEYYNPKVCAFVRKDKICLKKKKPRAKKNKMAEDAQPLTTTSGESVDESRESVAERNN